MPINSTLSERIDWLFTLTLSGLSTRYGTFQGQHYKQFLPHGIVLDVTYPPRPIPTALFEFAQRQLSGH